MHEPVELCTAGRACRVSVAVRALCAATHTAKQGHFTAKLQDVSNHICCAAQIEAAQRRGDWPDRAVTAADIRADGQRHLAHIREEVGLFNERDPALLALLDRLEAMLLAPITGGGSC